MQDIFLLFYVFLKVGIFGFGGGHAIVPLIQVEVVERNRWLTMQEFTDALAMANALPGPITTKMSVFTGYKIAGILGAFAALAGLVLPSTLLILVLTAFYFQYRELSVVKGAVKGVRPAVVALLFMVVWYLFPSGITSWHTALIAVLTFCFVVFLNVHPAVLIVGAAMVGILFYR